MFCTSIAGEEIGRIHTWGTSAAREADYQLASPSLIVDIPQTYLEPILVRNATARGTQSRFSTEYLSHTQDADGVDVQVLDRVTGAEHTIRAKYLIGADGARSKVAADLALPYEGAMDIAGSMNITFKADISAYCDHRPSVLYWVIQPGSNVGGIGAGLVRMIRPWNEWLIVWGYDISEAPPVVDDAAATQIVRNLLGMPELDVEITGTSLWGNNEMYATHLQSGRVFCAGDAIHRHPPSNGLGSNTSIQDSYNLAWKLAAVLRGQADPSLLETYSTERAPVAERIVKRANKSSREFVDLFVALGVTEAETEQEMVAAIEERKANTPGGAAKRAALVEAMELKNYEFNAHGVDLGQFYESSAVVPDGTVPAGADPRPRPLLRGLDGPGFAPAPRLGRRPPGQARDDGPGALRPVHPDLRHRGRGVGAGRGRGRPPSWGCRWQRSSSAPVARSPTCTTTGPSCARSRRRAHCWCVPTSTSPGAPTRSPDDPAAELRDALSQVLGRGNAGE